MTPTEITGWPLLILGLAVYRITRLIVIDSFPPVAWLRDKWLRRWPMTGDTITAPDRRLFEHKKVQLVRLAGDVFEVKQGTTLGYLISCVWCSGFWVAASSALLYWAFPDVVLPIASVFALAAIGSFVYNQEK